MLAATIDRLMEMEVGAATGAAYTVLAHAGKSGWRVVSAFTATAFAQESPRRQAPSGVPLPTK